MRLDLGDRVSITVPFWVSLRDTFWNPPWSGLWCDLRVRLQSRLHTVLRDGIWSALNARMQGRL